MTTHALCFPSSGDLFSQDRLACPCCSSVKLVGYWAVIAPFIRALVQPAHAPLVTMLECNTCGHRFFGYRYTSEEMNRLYGGYRGEHYLRTRHRLEPWYGRKMNDANLDPCLIRARQESLRVFLAPFLSSDQALLDIADLGGDAGQFIPLQLARSAYLIEASEQAPVPGVVRVRDLADLPHDLDLLICAHVLEHVPSPIAFIGAQIESPRIRSGCLIYLEVPLERYGISDQLKSKFYARYLRALNRIQSALVVIDFLSLLARAYLGRIFPPLIVKMHEHVNFFTMESLQACVESLGLELVAIKQESGSSLSTHQGVIRVLARRV